MREILFIHIPKTAGSSISAFLRYKKVEPHRDEGESFAENHRVHIPIKSNPKVEFTIYTKVLHKKISGEEIILTKSETKVMKEGEIWEINNVKEHSVENNFEQNRIHLIVDWHSLN